GIMRMHDHGEAEIGRHPIRDVLPAFGAIIRTIQAPMILQEEAVRASRVHGKFVDTLPEFRIPFGRVHEANAAVQRPPAAAAVVGPVNAPRRNAYLDARLIRRVERDGVQGKTAVSWSPPGTVRMIKKATHQGP